MPFLARIVFLTLGLVAVGTGIRILQQNQRTQKWNTTKGEILESSVAGIDEDFIVVKYHYRIEGIRYVGDRFSVSGGSVGHAPEVIKNYRPGAIIDVIYNPRNPGESFLVRNPVVVPIFIISAGMIFILVSLFASF